MTATTILGRLYIEQAWKLESYASKHANKRKNVGRRQTFVCQSIVSC